MPEDGRSRGTVDWWLVQLPFASVPLMRLLRFVLAGRPCLNYYVVLNLRSSLLATGGCSTLGGGHSRCIFD